MKTSTYNLAKKFIRCSFGTAVTYGSCIFRLVVLHCAYCVKTEKEHKIIANHNRKVNAVVWYKYKIDFIRVGYPC